MMNVQHAFETLIFRGFPMVSGEDVPWKTNPSDGEIYKKPLKPWP